jgi:cytochrome c
MTALRAMLMTCLAALAAIVAACGESGQSPPAAAETGEPEPPTAATLGEQVVLPVADYLEQPRYRDADADYGRNLVTGCRACHNVDRPESSPLGPSLYRLFGRRAGSLADFAYSAALAGADFVWTPEALDAWLAAPWRFVPGNRMAFPGLPDAAARDAVIAVLLRLDVAATAEGA